MKKVRLEKRVKKMTMNKLKEKKLKKTLMSMLIWKLVQMVTGSAGIL